MEIRTSIIIPTLQEEKLIRQTLSQFTASLRQHFGLEVIVSDGGSKDRTVEIACELADCVVVHSLPTRQTIAMGRNRGAETAKGEVLIFLNADCIIKEPEQFFSSMERFMQRPDLSAATCGVWVMPEEERLSDKLFHGFFNWYCSTLNTIGVGMGRGECHVMRKEIFHKLGGYNETFAAGEDFELYTRLRRLGKVHFERRLVVYESPRRYRKFGYARILWLWFTNAVSVLFLRRSAAKEWEVVR